MKTAHYEIVKNGLVVSSLKILAQAISVAKAIDGKIRLVWDE